MSNFDLAEEMAIANILNVLNSKDFAGAFTVMQRQEMIETVRNHVYKNHLKMNEPLTNNIAATPTAEQKAKLTPADEAARLWGEEPEQSYTPHL